MESTYLFRLVHAAADNRIFILSISSSLASLFCLRVRGQKCVRLRVKKVTSWEGDSHVAACIDCCASKCKGRAATRNDEERDTHAHERKKAIRSDGGGGFAWGGMARAPPTVIDTSVERRAELRVTGGGSGVRSVVCQDFRRHIIIIIMSTGFDTGRVQYT